MVLIECSNVVKKNTSCIEGDALTHIMCVSVLSFIFIPFKSDYMTTNKNHRETFKHNELLSKCRCSQTRSQQ
jgi:hypothetical protein